MALLVVVLLERKDIVLHAIALAFFGGLDVGGGEVDRLAVGRRRDVAGGRAVTRDLARFATFGVQQVDLIRGVGIAARDVNAIDLPSGDQRGLDSPRSPNVSCTWLVPSMLMRRDVAGVAVGFPVGTIDHERDLFAVR